jgi:hypothetical protein
MQNLSRPAPQEKIGFSENRGKKTFASRLLAGMGMAGRRLARPAFALAPVSAT